MRKIKIGKISTSLDIGLKMSPLSLKKVIRVLFLGEKNERRRNFTRTTRHSRREINLERTKKGKLEALLNKFQ